MTAKERALILFYKYKKEYVREIVKGKLQQTEHWAEVTEELRKLYKQEKNDKV